MPILIAALDKATTEGGDSYPIEIIENSLRTLSGLEFRPDENPCLPVLHSPIGSGYVFLLKITIDDPDSPPPGSGCEADTRHARGNAIGDEEPPARFAKCRVPEG